MSSAGRTLGHQLDLFSPRTRPVLAEPQPEPLPPVEEPPVPVLPGQTSIFETRELRLGPVSRELMVGRFDEASALCAALPRERNLAKKLANLAAHWSSVVSAEDLRSSRLMEATDDVKNQAVAPLNRALETGLLLRTAERLLAHGPTLLHDGRLAADLLREAGQTQRAVEAYRLAQEAFPGRARIGRANALASLGRGDEARFLYREAFLIAPEEACLGAVDDPAVQAVVDAVEELEDEAHPRWVPVLGELDRLWPLPRAEEALDETLRDFLGALIAARAAMRLGHPDVGARRELRRLAARLFRRLLNEGRC